MLSKLIMAGVMAGLAGVGWTLLTVIDNSIAIARVEGSVDRNAGKFTHYERRLERLERR